MAQPIPCMRCPEGADSAVLLTFRDDALGMDPGTTLGVCAPCWPFWIVETAASMIDPEGVPTPADAGEATLPSPAPGDVPAAPGAGDDAAETAVDQSGMTSPPKSGENAPANGNGAQGTKATTTATSPHD